MPNIMKYVITEEGRECSQCHVFKIWDCFHKNKASKLGHCSSCIACCYVYKKSPIPRESIENRMEGQRYSSKKYEKPVERMTTTHQYIEQKPYWDDSNMVELGTAPHPFLYNKIK